MKLFTFEKVIETSKFWEFVKLILKYQTVLKVIRDALVRRGLKISK